MIATSISILLASFISYLIGHDNGKKSTTIYHVVNYTGEIKELVINGQVVMKKPEEFTKEPNATSSM